MMGDPLQKLCFFCQGHTVQASLAQKSYHESQHCAGINLFIFFQESVAMAWVMVKDRDYLYVATQNLLEHMYNSDPISNPAETTGNAIIT